MFLNATNADYITINEPDSSLPISSIDDTQNEKVIIRSTLDSTLLRVTNASVSAEDDPGVHATH